MIIITKIICKINMKLFVYQKALFNTNISHQLFDYKITFVNSQRENINLNVDFVLKNQCETFVLKNSGIQKPNLTQIWYNEFN